MPSATSHRLRPEPGSARATLIAKTRAGTVYLLFNSAQLYAIRDAISDHLDTVEARRYATEPGGTR